MWRVSKFGGRLSVDACCERASRTAQGVCRLQRGIEPVVVGYGRREFCLNVGLRQLRTVLVNSLGEWQDSARVGS